MSLSTKISKTNETNNKDETYFNIAKERINNGKI